MESIMWAVLGMAYSLIAFALSSYKYNRGKPFNGKSRNTEVNYD
ncbi:hypothetical protein ABMY35_15755 [Pseudoalteromonas sp. BZB3]